MTLILRTRAALLLASLAFGLPVAFAAEAYRRPPQAILDVLDAPATPSAMPSPDGTRIVFGRPLVYPPVADLAEPMLRLAGVRINPRTNGPHGAPYFVALTIQPVAGGPEVPVLLPEGSRIGTPRWNADGTRIAFTNTTDEGVELWVADAATGEARNVPGVRLNPVLMSPAEWMPDQRSLLACTVPAGRGPEPAAPRAPSGPRVETSVKAASASSTYESRDLLKTPHDADRFEYYATSQVVVVALPDGEAPVVTPVGPQAVYADVEVAPNGGAILVMRIERPYSFLRPYYRFPAAIEVWDRAGRVIETIARLPLADQVPIHGERTGPRACAWRPTAPATLTWAEALDDGDTYKKVPHHDRIMMQELGSPAREILRVEQRLAGVQWLEDGRALVTERDEDRHWAKTMLVDVDGAAPSRVVWDRSTDDRYGNPGSPVQRVMTNGQRAVMQHDGSIYLAGSGASQDGDRPFLDRLDLRDMSTERLFRCDRESYESYAGGLDPAKGTFLTQRESPADPPNVVLRKLGRGLAAAKGEAVRRSSARKITAFPDPAPQLRALTKKLVTYERADGVPLSFTLYLPPGYEEGARLPTVLWAYPLDYTDPAMAGQVTGSTRTFTRIRGASPLFLALAGYAVLDNAAMPVVGPSQTAYDTFIEQITANAKAAIDKAVEMGVTDRDRVAVMGHSHGALMTANLLAWTDLFRAGVARSGAYNHTLRPFGFQNERRTLYEAPETYLKLSPLLHADKIDEPLLLIHGELDANPGTVTLQSEKLFDAIRGAGGMTRLVVLPFESHGYAARESTEHAIWEMLTWCDLHVRNAPPRAAAGGM